MCSIFSIHRSESSSCFNGAVDNVTYNAKPVCSWLPLAPAIAMLQKTQPSAFFLVLDTIFTIEYCVADQQGRRQAKLLSNLPPQKLCSFLTEAEAIASSQTLLIVLNKIKT